MPGLRYPSQVAPSGASADYIGSGSTVTILTPFAPGDSITANTTGSGGDAATEATESAAATASATAAASSATAAATSATAAAASAAAAATTAASFGVAAYVNPSTATANQIATALIAAGLMHSS